MWRRIFRKDEIVEHPVIDQPIDSFDDPPPPLRTPRAPTPLGLVEVGSTFAPQIPADIQDTRIDAHELADLALKLAQAVPQLTTEGMVQSLCLPRSIVQDLQDRLVKDKLIQITGQVGPLNHRLSITELGRERARWLLEVSGYIGPAPVSIEAYTEMLRWQCDQFPEVTPEQVAEALQQLVLPEEAIQVIGLALTSSRSLFLYGPPGNGKTSVGRLLLAALKGALWIPYCIGIENRIIRVLDPRFHRFSALSVSPEEAAQVDRRWLRIRRPLIIAGGELTLEDLELAYDDARRCYELPTHLKANGGIFLLDDFGCQPEEPHRLLNRWIVPLENHVDHLTLHSGQKLEIPFLQMLVVSTNLDPSVVMTPALLRRMGYRLQLDHPSAERFAVIFERYAALLDVSPEDGVITWLIQRHDRERRPLRACTPRDLIERCRDISCYTGRELKLSRDMLDLAWRSYFGETKSEQSSGQQPGDWSVPSASSGIRPSSKAGKLELICGCMFSGKTTELIARIHALPVGTRVVCMKPDIDNRYSEYRIVSHNGESIDALALPSTVAMLEAANDAEVVAIDEIHFLDDSLISLCDLLIRRGTNVICCGLDRDMWGDPFKHVQQLAEQADTTILYSSCARCGARADRTHRRIPLMDDNLVGGAEAFEPRCEKCFKPPDAPKPPARMPGLA